MNHTSEHTFHIPVMGLAYTMDTPTKVAHFGINSVISIVQDNLIEKMREHYYVQLQEHFEPITAKVPDHRARRITDYLNLVNRMVQKNIEAVRRAPFNPDSDIYRYFELLPDSSAVKKIFTSMVQLPDGQQKAELQDRLRNYVVPGTIDVNIMTKLDRNSYRKDGTLVEDGSDAVAAIRGYANSNLTNSSVILSAGMNPRLFGYIEKLTAFDVTETGRFHKKIVVKVSDFRSALIQGKMLAKKGLWVSEFRIESGLNCGGHAFATDGFLLGPILEEFKAKKEELRSTLYQIYVDALRQKNKVVLPEPHELKITVQGGIGTHEEDRFLRTYYQVDGTGWGTPFLLVPEATTVDEATLQKLCAASEHDIVLSNKSPLGVRFHYLKGSTAEAERLAAIQSGKPGSPCTEKFLAMNTEFGDKPLCTASRTYQKRKIEQLQGMHLPEADYKKQLNTILDKECLCVGLSNAAVTAYKLKPFKHLAGANVCPGPNLAYFNRIVSLRTMVDHIYGRGNIVARVDRPHMFLKELTLYVDYWMGLLEDTKTLADQKSKAFAETFYQNLQEGIQYYRNLTENFGDEFSSMKEKVEAGISEAEHTLRNAWHGFLDKVLVTA